MADEVDKGQAEGRLATKESGRSASVRAADTSTLEDIGIDKRRLGEWRKVRDACMNLPPLSELGTSWNGR